MHQGGQLDPGGVGGGGGGTSADAAALVSSSRDWPDAAAAGAAASSPPSPASSAASAGGATSAGLAMLGCRSCNCKLLSRIACQFHLPSEGSHRLAEQPKVLVVVNRKGANQGPLMHVSAELAKFKRMGCGTVLTCNLRTVWCSLKSDY